MSTLRVFTPRSTGIGIAVGVLVAGGFGHSFNAAWELAILNGFAAGALALAISICTRDGRFAFLIEKAHQRRPGFGVRLLAIAVMALPMFFVGDIVEIELFNRVPLTLLIGSTAWAAYLLSGIMMTLAYLDDGDAATDPGRYREAPPPGERGPMPPLRVFTARSAGIGIATGMLVAIALEQFLGTAWGLASLNGHSGEIDHLFRCKPITRSGANRSPVPAQTDHLLERSDAGIRHDLRPPVPVDGWLRFRIESPFRSSL